MNSDTSRNELMPVVTAAVRLHGGIVHGDFHDQHGHHLDVEFIDTYSAASFATAANPAWQVTLRDPITSLHTSVTLTISLSQRAQVQRHNG
jgi:hypothetical protein